jgi:transmembrane sensor
MEERHHRGGLMQTFPPALAIAGAIAAVSGSQLVGDAATIEYVSSRVGEQRPVRLSDGSVITLNTDSLIKMNVDGPALHVEVLRGEVLFNMLPNPHRHLVVSVRDLDIFDTATIFSVRLVDDGQIRVTVEEGEVRLSNANLRQVPLAHNQQAISDERINRLELKKGLDPRAIERQLAWREGRLVFVCEPLSQIAQEFNRYSLRKLEVEPLVANVQVGGEFTAADVMGFVELMPRLDEGIRWERAPREKGAEVLRLYRVPSSTHAARRVKPCES